MPKADDEEDVVVSASPPPPLFPLFSALPMFMLLLLLLRAEGIVSGIVIGRERKLLLICSRGDCCESASLKLRESF